MMAQGNTGRRQSVSDGSVTPGPSSTGELHLRMHRPSWGHPYRSSTFLSAVLSAALLLQPSAAHAQASTTGSTSAPAAASTGADSAAASPTAEELATAKMHFANGVELLQATPPNYQDAFRQFQLAYEK